MILLLSVRTCREEGEGRTQVAQGEEEPCRQEARSRQSEGFVRQVICLIQDALVIKNYILYLAHSFVWAGISIGVGLGRCWVRQGRVLFIYCKPYTSSSLDILFKVVVFVPPCPLGCTLRTTSTNSATVSVKVIWDWGSTVLDTHAINFTL